MANQPCQRPPVPRMRMPSPRPDVPGVGPGDPERRSDSCDLEPSEARLNVLRVFFFGNPFRLVRFSPCILGKSVSPLCFGTPGLGFSALRAKATAFCHGGREGYWCHPRSAAALPLPVRLCGGETRGNFSSRISVERKRHDSLPSKDGSTFYLKASSNFSTNRRWAYECDRQTPLSLSSRSLRREQ